MPEVLFRFVKQAASLAQKRCAASPTAVVSDPAGNGFAGWKHLTLHFLWIHMGATWRQLLDRSAAACDPGDHGALDATFFDRQAASSHYVDRSDRHIRTLKTTALVDTDSCAVLDIHCSAHWPHDTQVGRRVALRNTDEIDSLAGDKGCNDQSLRDTLRSEGVRPLIKHRLFAHYDHAHNARLDSDLYGQHWIADGVFGHQAPIRLRCQTERLVPPVP